MAKSKEVGASSLSGQTHPVKALLIEVKGMESPEGRETMTVSTEMFAALSIEEVLAYLRNRRPGFEVVELKVLGKVEVLSSSEHLE